MKKLTVLILAIFVLIISACDPSGGSVGDLFVNIGGYTDADDNIILAWENAETLDAEAAKYSIYKADSADGTFEPLSPPTSVNISDESAKLGPGLYDLELGETYYFKLKAEKSYDRDLDVDNPFSDAIKVTMRSADIFPRITSCFPQPSDSDDKVCLRWLIEAKPTFSDIADLEIYRKTGDGAYSMLYSPLDSATEHYDGTVADGTTYTYKMRVTYEDSYAASTKAYYESEERTIDYSHTPAPVVTINEPTLTSISVDTASFSYACVVTYDCDKNNISGDFGAELRFINSSGESTLLTTTSGNFGNTNPVSVNVDSTYLENGNYSLWSRVFVEYGGVRTYSDYLYRYDIVID